MQSIYAVQVGDWDAYYVGFYTQKGLAEAAKNAFGLKNDRHARVVELPCDRHAADLLVGHAHFSILFDQKTFTPLTVEKTYMHDTERVRVEEYAEWDDDQDKWINRCSAIRVTLWAKNTREALRLGKEQAQAFLAQR